MDSPREQIDRMLDALAGMTSLDRAETARRLADVMVRTGVSAQEAAAALDRFGAAALPSCDGWCKAREPHGPVWAEAVPGPRFPRVVLHTCGLS